MAGALLAVLGPVAVAHASPPQIVLEPVATGLASPVSIAHAGDGSGRLFIVQRGGQIVIYDGTQVLPTPFLDLDALTNGGGERGLLGLAFDPEYRANGHFFVNYTDLAGDTVVARYSVSADPDVADAGSAEIVLQIAQPFSNHNGGSLQFGPDGYLYVATGDGGNAGDPLDNAQNPQSLLGKMLRIDVRDGLPYSIPSSNPFVDDAGTLDEIWALGFRNPWRFSFDRLTGDLFIGDVGQFEVEEIDFQPASSPGGENYGWRRMEGSDCFNPPAGCDTGTLTLPILEYRHDEGCSVTGGVRYRGAGAPGLEGTFLFSDYCSGTIWGAVAIGGVWQRAVLLDTELRIVAFGEDEIGEPYLLDVNGGGLYRMATAPTCALTLDQFAYGNGETVTASTVVVTNAGAAPASVEVKLWAGQPGLEALSVVNAGANGTLSFAPGLVRDFGPIPLLQVHSGLARGAYEASCRFLDPVTGALLAENRQPFLIQ